MARRALRPWLGSLLAAALFLLPVSPAIALPNWLPHKGSQTSNATPRTGSGLQEVAPPGGVQELRRSLDKHRPKLRLLSPDDGAVVEADPLTLELEISDWPLHHDSAMGFGPHVVLQIDDQPPQRLSESDDGLIRISLAELNPGSHRFSAWAAYPWGEAVTAPGAAITWQLHRWQALAGTQPGQDAPWLVPIVPTSWRSGQPLLLNWLIWNAPLQNLRDGDQRWKLRLSLDGNSVLVDQQEAIWLKGPSHADGVTVQMELLDGLGEPLSPVFNNRVIHIDGRSAGRAAWTKSHLVDEELARLSGTAPKQAAVPDPETVADASDQPEPVRINEDVPFPAGTDSSDIESSRSKSTRADSTAADSVASDSSAMEPRNPGDGDSVAEDAEATDLESNDTNAEQLDLVPESPAESTAGTGLDSAQMEPEIDVGADQGTDTRNRLQSTGEEPLLIPQSSLGGSARELLELN